MTTTSRFLRIAQIFVLIFVLSAPWCLAQAVDTLIARVVASEAKADSLGAVLALLQEDSTSYMVVAAIKSVSGDVPEDEFFAAFWRFNYGKHFYSMANLDIALSNRPVSAQSDSVFSNQSRLTDAGIGLYYDVSHGTKYRKDNKRSIGIGPYVKIFNEEVYTGLSMTFVELAGSDFYSSYIQMALVHRLYLVTDSTRYKMVSDDRRIRLADQNVFFEVFINSQKENFFRYLAIRAGVLLPLTWDKGTFDDVQFRITVAVPVGRVIRF